jgi:hypothetical protein
MKVLQSAALQQQLMVAALTCHKSADYNQFVTSFRGQLIKSDNELKKFFAGRPRGEDYNAYKTRVANSASLRSLHDAQFCDSAQKVFDLALGRSEEHRGLAPEPPQLIDTGYEGCRPVEDRLITAEAAPVPEPKPAVKPAKTRVASLQLAKPPVVPEPILNPVDEHAQAFVPKAAPTTPVRVAALAPVGMRAPAAHTLSAQVPVVPAPARKAPQPSIAAAEPVRKAPRAPQPQTVQPERDAAQEPQRYADEQPQRDADAEPQRYADEDQRRDADEEPQRYADEQPQGTAAPPQRTAAAERPQWRRGDRDRAASRQDRDDDDLSADDNTPNAYRAGSTWADSERPAQAEYGPPPPRWAQAHRRSYLMRAPDGRWIVVIARQPRWVRD